MTWSVFIGPCPHGRDPWTRCETCEDAVQEAWGALVDLGCPKHPDVDSIIARAIAKAATASAPDRFRSYAARLLLQKMRDYSECRWFAGWHCANEFVLWGAVFHDRDEDLNEEAREGFRQLAEDACGWWAWGDDEPEETFVSLEEMERRWVAHTGGKP